MGATIITTNDLRVFKEELIQELKELLMDKKPAGKQWLKSTDVMEQLQISPGTLQNFRQNGTIPYMKIGGLIYYDQDDIYRVMEKNRVD
ncbi:helix-turn-helix domain-containing protein [Zhouia spongiae]|uniref:Helix-turn-helix domain-containing protein n=1 Tax=Zhouia spongiae TaxID=2202721 RepID=A0ABY3YKH4_9FLAO|nr:helix-turn-helix domain-containing protein [Zhouia spongiae]UNY98339.1 helix-turn-helix domain-containing protein [Zhouia spongiae]